MALIIVLQRHGDLINCLPIAYALSRKTGRVSWLVSEDCKRTLDGCSYVNPIPWAGSQDSLHNAIRAYANLNPIIPQAYQNPDNRRLTESFAREQWRLAGMIEHFHELPVTFDQQNPARANMLRDRVLAHRDYNRPLILACVDGISSPFPLGAKLLALLRGLDADVIDLRDVKAERVYDLIPLFNAADCLVTIDTLPVHLARAAYCPVVALLNNGWWGSIAPPQALATFTYSEAKNALAAIVDAVRGIIGSRRTSGAIVVSDVFDFGERAQKARSTWPTQTRRIEMFLHTIQKRTAQDIGDLRALPYFRDLLSAALANSKEDVLIWTNDDVGFAPGAIDKIKAHASKWNFGCVRRDPTHIGRECFWFRRDWLKANIDKMPDVILGAPKCDLVLAKWLRAQLGIPTTMENLALDFPPVELPAGLVTHEAHESRWLAYQDSPSARHNAALFVLRLPLREQCSP